MLKYGLRSESLEHAAASVGKLLGVTFKLHDSSFFGGDYFRAETAEGAIYVQPNYDAVVDEPFEASWPPEQFLVCFDGPEDEKWGDYIQLLSSLESSYDAIFLKRSIS